MKKLLSLIIAVCACLALAGCAASQGETATEIEISPVENELADGVYSAEFDTDSSMFKVNEANEDRGILTVQNGQMTIHISLMSKKILNLYPGSAEDAQKAGAVLLEPTVDEVTYKDGMTEEVFGFDVPVPYLDEEFDLALIGEKGKWYDHKVSVSDAIPLEDEEMYADVQLEGGSGKAYIESPCKIMQDGDSYLAVIVWSSPNYDYMIVGGETYYPENETGNSVFTIPVSDLDEPLEVQADTVAMSKPYLIDYTITFSNVTAEN